jgi:hypothetical protein
LTHDDRLAHLVIFMAALVVWALSGKDGKLFTKVQEQGQMKWDELRGGDKNG